MKARHDILNTLAGARAALIGNKTRDFAADVTARKGWIWPAETFEVLSLATGEPVRMLCAADFNARERAFELNHSLRAHYDITRLRAMRPVSGLAMADMRATAGRCGTATDDAVAAWRVAA
jgi:hypothetical protein